MPKKLKRETSEDQSDRFRAELKRMIDAGELNPTGADKQFQRLFEQAVPEVVPKKR